MVTRKWTGFCNTVLSKARMFGHTTFKKYPARRCLNYIFILDLTPGFNRLHTDNRKIDALYPTLSISWLHGDWWPGEAGGEAISHKWDIMNVMVSQFTGNSAVCSTVCSGVYQRKHPSSASLTLCKGTPPVWLVDPPPPPPPPPPTHTHTHTPHTPHPTPTTRHQDIDSFPKEYNSLSTKRLMVFFAYR